MLSYQHFHNSIHNIIKYKSISNLTNLYITFNMEFNEYFLNTKLI